MPPNFDVGFPLLRQTLKHLSQVPTDLTKYRFLPILWNENNVILTLPPAVI